jgi:hypothetical protein
VFEQLDLVRSELLIMKEVMHHSAHRGDQGASGQSLAQRSTANQGSQYGLGYSNQPAAAYNTQRLLTTPNGAARGYENAARMARNGAGKEELMRSCGITGHEAELLVKLHGQRGSGADLIGRQPRVVEPAAGDELANSARQSQTNNSVLQGGRQAATTARQTVAATSATQRTPERPATATRSPAIPRSRLVAVG